MANLNDDALNELDQAVLIHLRLSANGFGTALDRESAFELEGRLVEVLESTRAGEFDGDEFGAGEVILFIYGQDADRLFTVVEPLLRTTPFAWGGYAIKRYGGPGQSEKRVEL